MRKKSTNFSPIIKICGLTNLYQAMSCVELGADWLGFNCWYGSSRYIKPAEIQEITNLLPKFVTAVGVFVNESPDSLEKIMKDTGMDLAQLHGDESIEYIEKINVPCYKAFRFSPKFDIHQINSFGRELFLIDSYSKNLYGGSGKELDWEQASKYSSLGKLILAGGLNSENVIEAVKKVKPWGVDVCSGVEKEPGIKDMKKVANFIEKIRKNSKNFLI